MCIAHTPTPTPTQTQREQQKNFFVFNPKTMQKNGPGECGRKYFPCENEAAEERWSPQVPTTVSQMGNLSDTLWVPLVSRRSSHGESVTAAFPLLNNSLSVRVCCVCVCVQCNSEWKNESRQFDGVASIEHDTMRYGTKWYGL